ncbi:hypothetical protein SDJN02_10366 [Cucurbita argyrosperma subsp. argyrosperma]|nr:hypothetical protein SDJN02_10366 [Cucurbita argyrosperma subsp. argyrosperma]
MTFGKEVAKSELKLGSSEDWFYCCYGNCKYGVVNLGASQELELEKSIAVLESSFGDLSFVASFSSFDAL